MMQGKLRVRGDLPTILRYVQAAHELVVRLRHGADRVPRRGVMRAVVFVGPGKVAVADVPDADPAWSPPTRSCA